ncbi:hypothetical protein SDC9_111998 [bioreactor metagenome]|uniref:Uncharacterized protein n=1 Tax=bioreactor metagenome TaxID=1076179 RepID=A0A645BIU3_9ZZZZ
MRGHDVQKQRIRFWHAENQFKRCALADIVVRRAFGHRFREGRFTVTKAIPQVRGAGVLLRVDIGSIVVVSGFWVHDKIDFRVVFTNVKPQFFGFVDLFCNALHNNFGAIVICKYTGGVCYVAFRAGIRVVYAARNDKAGWRCGGLCLNTLNRTGTVLRNCIFCF